MYDVNRQDYEKELAERQRKHLENVEGFGGNNWRPCLHDQCSQCHGTGVRHDGSACVHCLSCPCPKCTPSY